MIFDRLTRFSSRWRSLWRNVPDWCWFDGPRGVLAITYLAAPKTIVFRLYHEAFHEKERLKKVTWLTARTRKACGIQLRASSGISPDSPSSSLVYMSTISLAEGRGQEVWGARRVHKPAESSLPSQSRSRKYTQGMISMPSVIWGRSSLDTKI